jgi:hypothetical protein
MNISIYIDLERLLKRKFEAGVYPSQEAAMEAALVRYLADEQESPTATARQAARIPGPFLEDEAAEAPFDLPRPGTVIPRSCVWDEVRHPDLATNPDHMEGFGGE